MGLSPSKKIDEKIVIKVLDPFKLDFIQNNESQLSGYKYRYYIPKNEKRYTHNFNNNRITILITDKTGLNVKEDFVEIYSGMNSFVQVSTKYGKMYEIKKHIDKAIVIMRLDLTNIIKEIVYITQEQ